MKPSGSELESAAEPEVWPLSLSGVVELPDGRRVRGCGRARGAAPLPQLSVALRGRCPTDRPGELLWLRWPDFRLPASDDRALEVLRLAHARAALERVELSCGAGIGRTGTAMAVLAMMSGVPADQAVAWVRAHYHPQAVETRGQRRWLARMAPRIDG